MAYHGREKDLLVIMFLLSGEFRATTPSKQVVPVNPQHLLPQSTFQLTRSEVTLISRNLDCSQKYLITLHGLTLLHVDLSGGGRTESTNEGEKHCAAPAGYR